MPRPDLKRRAFAEGLAATDGNPAMATWSFIWPTALDATGVCNC